MNVQGETEHDTSRHSLSYLTPQASERQASLIKLLTPFAETPSAAITMPPTRDDSQKRAIKD